MFTITKCLNIVMKELIKSAARAGIEARSKIFLVFTKWSSKSKAK